MCLLFLPQSGRSSSMAAEKTLNPRAPEFIPTSLFSDPYYAPPPPNSCLFYLHAFSTPFFSPLYANSYPPNPSLIISPPRDFSPVPLQYPPPPPPVESPAGEASCEDDSLQVEKRVVVEKFSPRILESKGVKKRWVSRKGGVGHESQNQQLAWRVRNISDDDDDDDDDDQNHYFGKADFKPITIITPRRNPKDVLRIHPGSNVTTVMIRNVPNKYTREMLMQFLDEHCMRENQKLKLENDSEEEDDHDHEEQRIVSAYDFLYLPIDFRTGMNKSYAFVNFTHPKAVWRFHVAAHNQKWELFHSKKIREIACAKIQGKEALVKQFEKTSFACEWEEFLPVCFSPARDGSGELVKQTTVGRLITTTHSSSPHHHLAL